MYNDCCTPPGYSDNSNGLLNLAELVIIKCQGEQLYTKKKAFSHFLNVLQMTNDDKNWLLSFP